LLFLNPNIFTGTQDSFRDCSPCSCNLPVETNSFVLDFVLIPCSITELQKPSSFGLEPRTGSRSYSLCPAISLLKQTTSVFALFLYRFQFPSYRNCPHRNSNSGQFSGFLTFLKYLPCLKEHACQIWCKSVYTFSRYKKNYYV
jgi:hypothetical protein